MYTAEISRRSPSCFLFLIDQSYSMAEPFGGGSIEVSKSRAMADAVNRLLDTLVGRCTKDEGAMKYFQVGVIGYGSTVGPALGGTLTGQDLVWIDEVADNPLRVEERMKKEPDGAGGLVELSVKFPVWFDPIADNGTPMCQALWQAHTILEGWVSQHPEAFPPVLINITDGESTDGDPYPASEAIRDLKTDDGNVLLLNLHLSSRRASQIYFPDSESGLSEQDKYAPLLYKMSSHLPEFMRGEARRLGYTISDMARGFVFNAEIQDAIQFLDIGTRTVNMR
ncbi:MAG: VWA domain-containing protein [Anaerolineales bacterium]|nr:VWA domain-containing protein [Anaerolineales bacterium]